MTVMNIARHFHRAEQFAYDPESRERRVEVEASAVVEMDAGQWQGGGRRIGPDRHGAGQRAERAVHRESNRADRLAAIPMAARPTCGSTASRRRRRRRSTPATSSRTRRTPRCRPIPRATAAPTPCRWDRTSCRRVDDQDDQRHGRLRAGRQRDGPGRQGQRPETVHEHQSGQIVVDPDFWRDAKNNRSGDRFTFEVLRGTVRQRGFQEPRAREQFRLRLAAYLPNGPHVLKLVARGDGAVTVDAFEVFEPPLK